MKRLCECGSPIKACGLCNSCYMKRWHEQTGWYRKNRTYILRKSKARGYSHLQEQRKDRVRDRLCTYSLCSKKIVAGNKMCQKHADETAVRNRRSHYHYTEADECRFQRALVCDWCSLSLNGETPTQDHDHSCCPKKGFSCGKCLRGLVHRVCNLHAIMWFEWYEESTGITLPMLEKYRANFPRRTV